MNLGALCRTITFNIEIDNAAVILTNFTDITGDILHLIAVYLILIIATSVQQNRGRSFYEFTSGRCEFNTTSPASNTSQIFTHAQTFSLSNL